MSHAEEVMDLIKKNNRYELIIREKDKIIAELRGQLQRQEEIHRALGAAWLVNEARDS